MNERVARKRPLVTLSLSPEAVAMLHELARAWGSSRSAVVERLAREETERRRRRDA